MGRIVIVVVAGGASARISLRSMDRDAIEEAEEGRYKEDQDGKGRKDGNRLYGDLLEDRHSGHGGQYRGSWGVWIVAPPA